MAAEQVLRSVHMVADIHYSACVRMYNADMFRSSCRSDTMHCSALMSLQGAHRMRHHHYEDSLHACLMQCP